MLSIKSSQKQTQKSEPERQMINRKGFREAGMIRRGGIVKIVKETNYSKFLESLKKVFLSLFLLVNSHPLLIF